MTGNMSSIKELIHDHERITTVLRPKQWPSQDPSAAIHQVRGLYLSHKHRECSKSAVIYLSRLGSNAHPFHRAALYFYAGLSCDTLARNMPYRSAQFFGNLDQAQLFYQHAIEALEIPEPQKEKQAHDNNSPIKPPNSQSLNVPASSSSHIPRLRRSATSLTELVTDEERPEHRLRTPSRRALTHMQVTWNSTPASPTKMLDGEIALPTSPEVKISTPKKISRLAYLTLEMQNYHDRTDLLERSNSSGKTITPKSLISRTRITHFNEELDAFADMVHEHSASVARFRQKVLAKQREEQSPAPFPASRGFQTSDKRSLSNNPGATGCPSGSRMGWDEMVMRIDRLRARNWVMPRFDAEHYQRLCETAMGDLER